MKTPKEYAVELVNKFRAIISKADPYSYLLTSDEIDLSKECAIICIIEILNDKGEPSFNDHYFNETISEINNL